MKKVTTLVFLGLLVSPLAFAGGASDRGTYAGLTVGQGKPGIAAVAPATLTDKSSTAWGGLLGHKFNKNFAVEGEYTTLGKVKDNAGGSAKGDAYGVNAVGILPMNDKFSVYGKLGYAHTKTSTSNFNASGTGRNAPTYGIGMQYNVNPMFGVRLGVDRFGVATKNALGVKTKANADVVSLGAVFNF